MVPSTLSWRAARFCADFLFEPLWRVRKEEKKFIFPQVALRAGGKEKREDPTPAELFLAGVVEGPGTLAALVQVL